MISNCRSVVFLCIVLNFSWNAIFAAKLKFLLILPWNVFQCSEYEYIVISNWDLFDRSKIRCQKQTDLFQNFDIPIIHYGAGFFTCDAERKQLTVDVHAYYENSKKKKLSKFDKKLIPFLSSKMTVDNRTYPSQHEKIPKNDSALVLHSITFNWTRNNTFNLEVNFDHQPTICRHLLNLERKVVNQRCSDNTGDIITTCFNNLLTELPLKNINWTFVLDLIKIGQSYSPNWEKQGGYYVDLRLFRSTTMSVSERLFYSFEHSHFTIYGAIELFLRR